MGDRYPLLRSREIIRALLRAGFYVHHQTGSHMRLLHRIHVERRVTVPVHSNDVPRPTLHRILEQAQLTLEEFSDFL